MIIKQLTLATLNTGVLDFGYVGENNHIKYVIQCDSVFDDYPDASASLLVKAPPGTVYPKQITQTGKNVEWMITESDTAYPGSGQIQLTFTDDGTVVKTVISNTNVKVSLVGDDPPPDPITDWITQANEIIEKVDGMTASAETLSSGSDASATVETVDGHYNLSLGIPRGEPGDPSEIIDDDAGDGDVTKVWSASKTYGEVSALKSDLENITLDQTGDNINNSTYEGGYIASAGTDTTSSSYLTVSFRTKDYIPVIGGKTLYWWGYLTDNTPLGANAVIVEYNSSKTLIGTRHDFNKYGTTGSNQAFTLSANAAYVRFALYQGIEDFSTVKIALYYEGNEKAAFVPYTESKVVDYFKVYTTDGKDINAMLDGKFAGLGITPIYQYETITVQGVSGALKPDGTVTETNDVTRYKIAVNKGEKYCVSARHGYAYKAFLVLDSNDNVLSYYPSTNSGTEIHRNVEVSIEQDGYLVLQDVYNFMPILGSVSHYDINDRLYGKTVYWNGDSVCFGAGGTSFADQISLFHAMPETMDAVSGTRLSTRTGYTNSIYERVAAMDTSAKYDYIGIEGGFNDYFSSVTIGSLTSNFTDTPDTTTVVGAVEGICKFIRTNFSDSKFFFVLGHRPINVGQYNTGVDTYWDAIISALNKWAVPYVDIRKEGTLMAYNSDWLSTYFGTGETMGTHPNTLGYKLFYNDLVESKMKTL